MVWNVIISSLVDENSKEQQRIDKLQRQLDAKLAKQGKDETRQKILLGAFLLDLLEHDKVGGLRQYTVEHLNHFLPRDGDRVLLSPVVANVKKLMGSVDTSAMNGQVIGAQEQGTSYANS